MQQKSSDNLLASQAPTLPDSSSSQIVPMHLTRYLDQYPDPPHPHASALFRTRYCHEDPARQWGSSLLWTDLWKSPFHTSPQGLDDSLDVSHPPFCNCHVTHSLPLNSESSAPSWPRFLKVGQFYKPCTHKSQISLLPDEPVTWNLQNLCISLTNDTWCQ